MQVNIRQAGQGDVEQIERVAEESWEQDYPNIMNREALEEGVHEWYDDDMLKQEIANEDAIVLVAEDDEGLAGFAHAIWQRRTGHILRVYVKPDRRGEGIGRELLASIRDALHNRGSDEIRATVLADNEPGNEFYQSFGFEKVDEADTVIGGESYTENVYEKVY